MVNLPPVTLVLCVTSRFHCVHVSGGQEITAGVGEMKTPVCQSYVGSSVNRMDRASPINMCSFLWPPGGEVQTKALPANDKLGLHLTACLPQ